MLVLNRGKIKFIDGIVLLPSGEVTRLIDDKMNKYHGILGMDNVMEMETRVPTDLTHI